IVRAERVGSWRWIEQTCTTMSELEALAGDELGRTVLRLRLQMRLTAPQYERAEQLLRTLRGTDVVHGKVGVLTVDRSELELDTRDFESTFEDLPEVLQATIRRLEAAQTGDMHDPAKAALYHLYRLIKEAR